MTTDAKVGFGVRFMRLNATTNAYEDLGQLVEPGGPSMSRDAVDGTHARSTNRYREFIGGMRDGGEVTATLILKPGAVATDDHAKLVADFNNDDPVTYRLLFPNANATSWTLSGLITKLDHAEPIDDKMTLALSIKISGQPTLADNAA